MPPAPRPPVAQTDLSAEAALSFLKDTKGALAWTARDLADTLKVSRAEAEQALEFLEAQGYVKRASGSSRKGHAVQWMTTPAGETVSGAKPTRFTRESVEQGLTALQDRIRQNNKSREAPFRISDAVAFGDFLLPDRARVQSADVGINLVRRTSTSEPGTRNAKRGKSKQVLSSTPLRNEPRSASEAKEEREFLRRLRAKSAHLNLQPYADWMRRRTHRDLL